MASERAGFSSHLSPCPEGEGGREGGREDEGGILPIYNVHLYMYTSCVHVCIACWPHVHCKLVVDGAKKGNPDPIHQQTLLMS